MGMDSTILTIGLSTIMILNSLEMLVSIKYLTTSTTLIIVYTDIDEHEWIVSTCRKGVKDGEPLPYAMETSKTRT